MNFVEQSRITLVVFDLAGTTIEDDGTVLDCLFDAAESVGLRATEAELVERMGRSKREVFEELAVRQYGLGELAEEVRDAGYDAFRRIVEDRYWREGVRSIPGTEETFAWLIERRVKLALNTGFHRRVTEQIVDLLGWRTVVDAIVASDEVLQGGPAPFMIHTAMSRCRTRSVESVAVVGDTASDMLAGARSGARAVIGVRTGGVPTSTLLEHGATLVVDSVRDVPDVLEALELEHVRVAI